MPSHEVFGENPHPADAYEPPSGISPGALLPPGHHFRQPIQENPFRNGRVQDLQQGNDGHEIAIRDQSDRNLALHLLSCSYPGAPFPNMFL